jgi:hypothetical protein
MNNVVHGRFGNFVRRAFLMACAAIFASAPSMVEALALALGESTEGHHGESGNCNESFDGFHGRIP